MIVLKIATVSPVIIGASAVTFPPRSPTIILALVASFNIPYLPPDTLPLLTSTFPSTLAWLFSIPAFVPEIVEFVTIVSAEFILKIPRAISAFGEVAIIVALTTFTFPLSNALSSFALLMIPATIPLFALDDTLISAPLTFNLVKSFVSIPAAEPVALTFTLVFAEFNVIVASTPFIAVSLEFKLPPEISNTDFASDSIIPPSVLVRFPVMLTIKVALFSNM